MSLREDFKAWALSSLDTWYNEADLKTWPNGRFMNTRVEQDFFIWRSGRGLGAQSIARTPLPVGDRSIPQTEQGLFRKYEVVRTDGQSGRGEKHENCEYFVLDVDHDPHSRAALIAYMLSARKDYPLLAQDMHERYNLPDPGAV